MSGTQMSMHRAVHRNQLSRLFLETCEWYSKLILRTHPKP